MFALTHEAFVLKAIERLPDKESRHLGARRSMIEPVFRQHFGADALLDTVLDRLVREKKVVAARLVWTVRPHNHSSYSWKARIKEVVRLTSFPDPLLTEETDPILYLPDRIPRLIKVRLCAVQNALDRILED